MIVQEHFKWDFIWKNNLLAPGLEHYLTTELSFIQGFASLGLITFLLQVASGHQPLGDLMVVTKMTVLLINKLTQRMNIK